MLSPVECQVVARARHRLQEEALAIGFDPSLHPRDRRGRFSQVLSRIANGNANLAQHVFNNVVPSLDDEQVARVAVEASRQGMHRLASTAQQIVRSRRRGDADVDPYPKADPGVEAIPDAMTAIAGGGLVTSMLRRYTDAELHRKREWHRSRGGRGWRAWVDRVDAEIGRRKAEHAARLKKQMGEMERLERDAQLGSLGRYMAA